MDTEIATTLDLDSVTSVEAHPTVASSGAREAIKTAETVPATVSRGSTLVLAGSSKSFSLLPL